MVPRRALSILAALIAALTLSATSATGQEPQPAPGWQAAADRAGIPLYAPTDLELALQRVLGQRLSCARSHRGQAEGFYLAPGRGSLAILQGDPSHCSNFGAPDAPFEPVTVGGRRGELVEVGTGPHGFGMTVFFRQGRNAIQISTDFEDREFLLRVAEGLVEVAPRPARALRIVDLDARVVRVLSADTVVVRVGARRERIALAGVRAPQPTARGRRAGCLYPQARRALARQLPVGARVQVETDPLRATRDGRGRLVAYLYRGRPLPFISLERSVNARMLGAGMGRLAPGAWRHRATLLGEQREAARARRGIFTPRCRGSVAPPKVAARPAPSRAPAPSPPRTGVRAGQFCKTADIGRVVIAANGAQVRCTPEGGGRARWRNV